MSTRIFLADATITDDDAIACMTPNGYVFVAWASDDDEGVDLVDWTEAVEFANAKRLHARGTEITFSGT